MRLALLAVCLLWTMTGCADYGEHSGTPDAGEDGTQGPDGEVDRVDGNDTPDDGVPLFCYEDHDCPGYDPDADECCGCSDRCLDGQCISECVDSECCSMPDGCNWDCQPMHCNTNQDCATPGNPALPEDACCGCGAWCEAGQCTTMCVDAMCCFGGGGCGPNCEMLCSEHEHCFEDMRCIEGECHYAPPACGEDPNPNCHEGLGQVACAEYQGLWVCGPAGICWCLCPTGDAGCPCWLPSHCSSTCYTELTNNECAAIVMGTCHGYIHLPPGCYCVASDDGAFYGLCID